MVDKKRQFSLDNEFVIIVHKVIISDKKTCHVGCFDNGFNVASSELEALEDPYLQEEAGEDDIGQNDNNEGVNDVEDILVFKFDARLYFLLIHADKVYFIVDRPRGHGATVPLQKGEHIELIAFHFNFLVLEYFTVDEDGLHLEKLTVEIGGQLFDVEVAFLFDGNVPFLLVGVYVVEPLEADSVFVLAGFIQIRGLEIEKGCKSPLNEVNDDSFVRELKNVDAWLLGLLLRPDRVLSIVPPLVHVYFHLLNF